MLHFVIQYSANNDEEYKSLCLQELLVYLRDQIKDTDCYSESYLNLLLVLDN